MGRLGGRAGAEQRRGENGEGRKEFVCVEFQRIVRLSSKKKTCRKLRYSSTGRSAYEYCVDERSYIHV